MSKQVSPLMKVTDALLEGIEVISDDNSFDVKNEMEKLVNMIQIDLEDKYTPSTNVIMQAQLLMDMLLEEPEPESEEDEEDDDFEYSEGELIDNDLNEEELEELT